ncbi:alpha-1,2-mannosyltransferase [Aspergillus luchuensis]|uniref:Alpha-1,2-mannosyltransferase n=1 Tax=Aspergillus kawachii TaxID=1069201 RepID=A0A146FGK2_ASPKA|nr:alpha-1,2-mannosyltransferase [Aspergillus luchuensis]
MACSEPNLRATKHLSAPPGYGTCKPWAPLDFSPCVFLHGRPSDGQEAAADDHPDIIIWGDDPDD